MKYKINDQFDVMFDKPAAKVILMLKDLHEVVGDLIPQYDLVQDLKNDLCNDVDFDHSITLNIITHSIMNTHELDFMKSDERVTGLDTLVLQFHSDADAVTFKIKYL